VRGLISRLQKGACLTGLLGAFPGAANAFTCVYDDLDHHLRSSDAAFVGVVIDTTTRLELRQNAGVFRVTDHRVAVTRVFHGVGSDTVTVRTRGTPQFGYRLLEVGVEYLVFGRRQWDHVLTRACDGTQPASDPEYVSAVARLAATLGPADVGFEVLRQRPPDAAVSLLVEFRDEGRGAVRREAEQALERLRAEDRIPDDPHAAEAARSLLWSPDLPAMERARGLAGILAAPDPVAIPILEEVILEGVASPDRMPPIVAREALVSWLRRPGPPSLTPALVEAMDVLDVVPLDPIERMACAGRPLLPLLRSRLEALETGASAGSAYLIWRHRELIAKLAECPGDGEAP